VFIAAKIPGLGQVNEMVLWALESLIALFPTHTSESWQIFLFSQNIFGS
jgi:hypothetical protein